LPAYISAEVEPVYDDSPGINIFMVWRGMSMINMYSINAIMFRARCGPLKKTVLSYGMFFPAL
jgi:hypothetical protein